jgi:RNA polymerase sigma-70 factor (ECF subfamily)
MGTTSSANSYLLEHFHNGREDNGARLVNHHAAMNQFLASVEKKAFRMAQMATKNREEALDIVQDAMLGLQRYHDKPNNEWKPLFYTILQSRINDWHRKNIVRSKIMVAVKWFKDDEDQADIVEIAVADRASEPLDRLAQRDTTEAIIQALELLPLRQQQAFMLRAWEGFSVAEAAGIMSCSQSSVKTHYSRALQAMRNKLQECSL